MTATTYTDILSNQLCYTHTVNAQTPDYLINHGKDEEILVSIIILEEWVKGLQQ